MKGQIDPQPPLDERGRRFEVEGCLCDPTYYHAHESPDCPFNWYNLGLAMGCEPVLINGRRDWELLLPPHRAARPQWGWWEATRLAAMRTVIGPGDVVYDVGAEEGDFPALWALWGASVVLAEPNPRVWPNVRLVFEANALPPPLLCWPGFFGNEADLVSRIEDHLGLPDWAKPRPGGWPECAYGPVIGDHGFCQVWERPDIPAITIDDVVKTYPPPTVITMDVEGSELHVLQGAEQTLLIHRPQVFVSVHREFMQEQYGQTPEELEAFMVAVGYESEFLCLDHEAHTWFRPVAR